MRKQRYVTGLPLDGEDQPVQVAVVLDEASIFLEGLRAGLRHFDDPEKAFEYADSVLDIYDRRRQSVLARQIEAARQETARLKREDS